MNKEFADELVKRMHEIIGYHINIISKNGVIISSSDPSRIGKTHTEAMEIIETNTLVRETYKNDAGVKPGVNAVVKKGENILCVVGISGNPEEVKKYHRIATEFILLNNDIKEKEKNANVKRVQKQNTILAILYGFKGKNDFRLIKKYKEKFKGSVSAFKFHNVGNIEEECREYFGGDVNIVGSYFGDEDKIIGFLETTHINELVNFAKSREIKLHIGCPVNNIDSLWKSYESIRMIKSKNQVVVFDDDPILPLVGAVTTNGVAVKKLIEIANKLSEYDADWNKIIKAYVEFDFVKSTAAKETHYHLNTFKNKLMKYSQVMGVKRHSSDFKVLCFYLNCQF